MPKRTMPAKTVTVDLAEWGYEGFHAETRLNAPPRLLKRYLELLRGGLEDEDEARDILLDVFPSWDFVDNRGSAIAHTRDGFEEIPADLATAMMVARSKALQEAAMPRPLGSDSSTTDSPPPTDSPEPRTDTESGRPTRSGR